MPDRHAMWRVVWEDRTSGQGHDVVEAPDGYHAVWAIASSYDREVVSDMTFVRVERVRVSVELTDEHLKAFERMALRRRSPGSPEAEAALFGSWADTLAAGIEQDHPADPETGDQQ